MVEMALARNGDRHRSKRVVHRLRLGNNPVFALEKFSVHILLEVENAKDQIGILQRSAYFHADYVCHAKAIAYAVSLARQYWRRQL